jgi:CHAT domain-containing protein
LNSLAPNSPAAAKYRDWLEARRHLAHLLRQSPTVSDPEQRRAQLAQYDRQVAKCQDKASILERDLIRELPEIQHQQKLQQFGPGDLAWRLPLTSALIDYRRYDYFEQLPDRPDSKGERRTPAYLAFVLLRGRQPIRVELGPAEPIDQLVRQWRQAVAAWSAREPAEEQRRRQQHESAAAAELRRKVWEPLAQHFPKEITTVYLAPDGDLAGLAFAALPGSSPGRLLLDELTLAVLPHAPFLLEQLLRPAGPAPQGRERVLAVGGVAYSLPGAPRRPTDYPDLPGTLLEAQRLGELAGLREVVPLGGTAATVECLLAELPKARYAHLATHGFFDEPGLSQERQREQRHRDQLRQSYMFQEGTLTERVGVGGKWPSEYTGLVLAGANRPQAADPHRGILTSTRLQELPLEKLRLAVLSACETGLGDLTAGEGVQGLVRSFHIAGCPDVVASLWNVDDRATAALMARFYHELWQQKQPPLDALVAAQRHVCHHPEQIDALAGPRSRIPVDKPEKTPEGGTTPPPAPARASGLKRTPTKLWAAFVLSGLGR